MAGATTTLIAAIAALAAGIAEPEAARRDPLTAASDAIAGALVPIALAEAYVAQCRPTDPAGDAARREAHARWREVNAVRPFEAALATVARRAPELAAGHDRMRDAAVAQVAETLSRDPTPCRRLPATLADPQYRIVPVTAKAAPLLHRLAATLDATTTRHASR